MASGCRLTIQKKGLHPASLLCKQESECFAFSRRQVQDGLETHGFHGAFQARFKELTPAPVVWSKLQKLLNTDNIVSNKGQLLQDPFLNALRREHVPVSIYLVNGIKLQGQIESFDQYVVLLRNTVTQMVYKHAISTIVPGRSVTFSTPETGEITA